MVQVPQDSSSSEVDSNDLENCYNHIEEQKDYDFFGESSKKYMSNNSVTRISLDNSHKIGMILDIAPQISLTNQRITSADSSFR